MRVGITGHRGLSPEVEQQVRLVLTEAVKAYDATELTGVSCIADGPDSWFARTVLDHGGRIEVVLPAAQYRADLSTNSSPSGTANRPAATAGGTADVVAYARRKGVPARVIWPEGAVRG